MASVRDGSRTADTRIFVNRADRIPVRIPVVFTCTEGKIRGRSVDISESGILATFEHPLDVWLTGQLSILLPEHPLFVETRVARADNRTVAMSFRNMTARDLQILKACLQQLGLNAS